MKTDVSCRCTTESYKLLAACYPLRKKAGFGSVSQWFGSLDPDPYQNVTDPQHWFEHSAAHMMFMSMCYSFGLHLNKGNLNWS
jgi:hypothetical protein